MEVGGGTASPPLQSSSTPLPGTSIAPGWTLGSESSQSPSVSEKPSPSSSRAGGAQLLQLDTNASMPRYVSKLSSGGSSTGLRTSHGSEVAFGGATNSIVVATHLVVSAVTVSRPT